ncbi:hypothetical protein ASPWEDRAFT_183462 [Aspergillus wentii DTO 134E9]|uniref:Mid2 domain-containing protein n=1 Tax=Aspergillus wentii DTO 134E9 TaxID=1073089 RepID=A0A1L9RKD7_ASPWE|nr:uncharacterized protein ASPWEDRAFT_183462 [Aspergillus wentii DTO 134E9]KAI9924829.1 hypothetical protein MW887_006685 [Aspergillus wentii]OJJ35399.1 hypothetical protein ASPWEDRAFT_183462 [Aspergillus wentii DTO 134E9]
MRWLLASILTFTLTSAQQCYFPDGTKSNDVPCSSDKYTHCCSANDICLTNGLCYSVSHQPFVLSRASCTDQNWGSSCPQYCYGSQDNTDGGCTITNLRFLHGISTYCCGNPVVDPKYGNVSCLNGEEPFTIGPAEIIPGRAGLSNLTAKSTSSTNSSHANTTSSFPIPSGVCDSEKKKNVAIGAGVGVPLGVIALSALLWGFWERKQRAKERQIEPAFAQKGAIPFTGVNRSNEYGINRGGGSVASSRSNAVPVNTFEGFNGFHAVTAPKEIGVAVGGIAPQSVFMPPPPVELSQPSPKAELDGGVRYI